MNKEVLKKYGITILKKVNGQINVTADNPVLDIYIYMFSKHKKSIQDFLFTIDLAVNNYSAIPYDNREWHKEVGKDLYTGIIQNDGTFDLFQEDFSDETIQTYPLSDIKEIFTSLLEVLNNN